VRSCAASVKAACSGEAKQHFEQITSAAAEQPRKTLMSHCNLVMI
jgi:hypothetical protein